MRLKFEISPISGGFTAQFVQADYRQLKLRFNNDAGKGKFSVSSVLTLRGDDYDFFIDEVIVAANGYTITCYGAGGEYWESDYKTVEITTQNVSLKLVSFSLIAETEYLDENWVNFDKEYNIAGLGFESNDLYFKSQQYPLEDYGSNPVSFTDEDLTACDLSALNISGWDIDTFNITSHTGTGPYLYTGTVNYKRKYGLGFYIDTDKYDPDGELYSLGTWSYLIGEDETLGGVVYPKYKMVITPDYSCSGTGEPFVGPYTNDADYTDGDVTIEYNSVSRKVTDVIEWLFTQMGLTSIVFDSSGTATDSFYSFKTMTGESLTYGATTTDKLYAHLLLINLTDFIPADDDGQKDIRARLTNVSLKTLLDYFESLNFEWFLEERTGVYYFILQHKSDKSLGGSNPDLTDYKGRNWIKYANIYDVEPYEYRKIVNESTAKGIDFKNLDIDFTNVYSTDTAKTITDNKIYVDLDDIANRKSDAYSEIENNNLVMIAAQQDGVVKDYVRAPTGLISQSLKNNVELGFMYLGRWIYGEYPDADFTIGGTSYTATSDRLKKREKVEIKGFPGDDIKTDFSVSDAVNFGGDSAELDSLEQDAVNNYYDIRLKK